jgi:amino acid adenylation domain-containing protein
VREPYLIHHYLEHSASTHPDTYAVIDGEETISYGEMQRWSARIASFLIGAGTRPGDRVGILLSKSIEAVAAIYGALRAGAVYVPIDTAAPPRRVGYIVKNCGLRVLVSERNRRSTLERILPDTDVERVILLDESHPSDRIEGVPVHTSIEIDQSSEDPRDAGTIEEDLAYILYTSGSTGSPKGVMLSHANCLGFVRWAVDEFAITQEDRLSSHAPFHFDLSTFDLFGAALAGAPVVLVPPKLSVFPSEVRRLVDDHRITVMYAVPSILVLMTEHAGLSVGAMPSLRTMLFAGEVFPTKYLSRLMRLLPHVEFANLYGPTETNVCTWYRVPEPPEEEGPPISIGRSIANVETFVLGDDHKELSPGSVGELYVRGPTVMKGYWGDPQKTSRRLIPSPVDRHHGDLVYRTGDLVEETAEGDYRFLGRRDNQVKSRGYRIELGEIESVVSQHPAVVECSVVAVPDERISNRIECFVAGSDELGSDELTRFCTDRIPRYMVPEQFHVVDSLPKTSTGKIDRQVLLADATGLIT